MIVTRRRGLRRLLFVALLTALSGCACRLSGTPLDTMEKNVNPACWFS